MAAARGGCDPGLQDGRRQVISCRIAVRYAPVAPHDLPTCLRGLWASTASRRRSAWTAGCERQRAMGVDLAAQRSPTSLLGARTTSHTEIATPKQTVAAHSRATARPTVYDWW